MSKLSSASDRGLLAATAAMLLQATWAAYANYAHGWQYSARAAVAQGASSFSMTFLITLVIEALFNLFKAYPAPLKLLLIFVLAILTMLAMQIGVHLLAGTPELFLTIAPPATLGTGYWFFDTLGRVHLGKSRKPL
jgi:hypothetical protein